MIQSYFFLSSLDFNENDNTIKESAICTLIYRDQIRNLYPEDTVQSMKENHQLVSGKRKRSHPGSDDKTYVEVVEGIPVACHLRIIKSFRVACRQLSLSSTIYKNLAQETRDLCLRSAAFERTPAR